MADIVMGIPGLAIICISCGKQILERVQSFKNFESELEDLSQQARVQWMSLQAKIELIAKLNSDFQQKDREYFEKVIINLRTKLEDISSRIENIPGKSAGLLSQLKSAFRPGKKGLNRLKETISEFATLHKSMIPSFLLLAKLPGIDRPIKEEPSNTNTSISTVQKLRKAFSDLEASKQTTTQEAGERAKQTRQYIREAVRFTCDNTYWEDRKQIQYASVQTHTSREDNSLLMIDSIPCDGKSRAAVNIMHDVQELALILKAIDDPMTFGLLACAGIAKEYKNGAKSVSSLEMVLKVPRELVNPRSLRSLLCQGTENVRSYSINARIEFAKQLARTVSFVHSAKFVHKNFRPETIIVFDSRRPNDQRIGSPFLVGFQKFRAANDGNTTRLGDTAWEKNIYRHPERQGQFPEEVYRMDHDIYSLGVCLLEIALWKSFVAYDENGDPLPSPESKDLADQNGYTAKDMLVRMAREMIPVTLGEKYADVTIACLEGLDEADTSVEASYIENILDKLDQISV